MGRFHPPLNSSFRNIITSRTLSLMKKQGFIYMAGRDHKFRPIIFVDVGKVKEADLKDKTFENLMGFFFQFVVQNCLLEGQV